MSYFFLLNDIFDSVLLIILFILAECRYMTNKANINCKILNLQLTLSNVNTAELKPTIDDKDTILDITKVIKKTINGIKNVKTNSLVTNNAKPNR